MPSAPTVLSPAPGISTQPADTSQGAFSATSIPQQSSEPTAVSPGNHGFSTCDTDTPTPGTAGLTTPQFQRMASLNTVATPGTSGGNLVTGEGIRSPLVTV